MSSLVSILAQTRCKSAQIQDRLAKPSIVLDSKTESEWRLNQIFEVRKPFLANQELRLKQQR